MSEGLYSLSLRSMRAAMSSGVLSLHESLVCMAVELPHTSIHISASESSWSDAGRLTKPANRAFAAFKKALGIGRFRRHRRPWRLCLHRCARLHPLEHLGLGGGQPPGL